MNAGAEWTRRAPASALRGVVEGYLGYRFHGGAPGVQRGIPSRHLTFIVSIGPPIHVVRQTNATQAPGMYRTVVGGLQATSALIAHDGTQEGVAIRMSPLGCAVLFGTPAAELWDLSAELSSVVGRVGDELWERVQNAPSWQARFDACDRVLLTLLKQSRTASGVQSVAGAWQDIVAEKGTLAVDELARRAGYSRQRLTRMFHRELGLGPKVASRIVRFDHAVSLLRHPATRMSLAEVAHVSGFVDQAHMTREFAAMAGHAPRELLAGAIPIVPPELFRTSKTTGPG